PTGAFSRVALAGVLLNPGQQAAPVLPVVAVGVPAGAERSPSVLAQGVRLPLPRVEGGGGGAVVSDGEPDEVPAELPGPQGEPAGSPGDPAREEQGGTLVRQQAGDLCLAGGSWRADPRGAGVPAGEE